MASRRRRGRGRSPSRAFLQVSRRQVAGLGVVGVLGVLGGLNAGLDLAEKIARLAHGRTPSGKPVTRE